jgi:ABC-type multidrug transport system fused ATPase/permease subunit
MAIRLSKWLHDFGRRYRILLFVSIFFGIIECSAYAVTGALISHAVSVGQDPLHSESEIALICGMFIVVIVVNNISSYIRVLAMSLYGARVTQQLRIRFFGALLRQEAAWFEYQRADKGWRFIALLSVNFCSHA